MTLSVYEGLALDEVLGRIDRGHHHPGKEVEEDRAELTRSSSMAAAALCTGRPHIHDHADRGPIRCRSIALHCAGLTIGAATGPPSARKRRLGCPPSPDNRDRSRGGMPCIGDGTGAASCGPRPAWSSAPDAERSLPGAQRCSLTTHRGRAGNRRIIRAAPVYPGRVASLLGWLE
jgi:hypothetical protein